VKVGDLVTPRDTGEFQHDMGYINPFYGFGIVLKEEHRMVTVKWSEPDEDGDCTFTVWKANLRVVSPS